MVVHYRIQETQLFDSPWVVFRSAVQWKMKWNSRPASEENVAQKTGNFSILIHLLFHDICTIEKHGWLLLKHETSFELPYWMLLEQITSSLRYVKGTSPVILQFFFFRRDYNTPQRTVRQTTELFSWIKQNRLLGTILLKLTKEVTLSQMGCPANSNTRNTELRLSVAYMCTPGVPFVENHCHCLVWQISTQGFQEL